MSNYKPTAARQVEMAARTFELQQRNAELTKALRELVDWYTEKAGPLPGAWPEVITRARAVLRELPAPKPAELPDEPWALNVAPRYTPGSPALVSRRTGEQVAKEERDAYERHLEGLYGPEGVEKARRLGLSRIVYERVRERSAKGGTKVEWLDTITGERFEELHR